MASFLSPFRGNPRCRYTRGSGISRILATPYGARTGGGNTGFPLKKVSPYFCFSLALNAWILGHSSDSALAFPGTWTTELTCGVPPHGFSSGGLPSGPKGHLWSCLETSHRRW